MFNTYFKLCTWLYFKIFGNSCSARTFYFRTILYNNNFTFGLSICNVSTNENIIPTDIGLRCRIFRFYSLSRYLLAVLDIQSPRGLCVQPTALKVEDGFVFIYICPHLLNAQHNVAVFIETA